MRCMHTSADNLEDLFKSITGRLQGAQHAAVDSIFTPEFKKRHLRHTD